MKKLTDVTNHKVNNYITQPKQSIAIQPKQSNAIQPTEKAIQPTEKAIQPTETKTYNKPTMTPEEIIAANQNSKPIKINQITDREGLKEAYKRPSGLYINANTLYIAGTRDAQDVWDDLKIPVMQTSKALRYKNAVDLLKVNQDVSNIVGHSLGGATTLELQKNFKDKNYNVNTYGAPVLSLSKADDRYRNHFDPVSMLDFGSQSSLYTGLNPHTYHNFDTNKVSDKPFSSFTYRTDS